MPRLNATAVLPLNENTIDLLKKMQMNHPVPDGANYIAFLDDGDACFLESIDSGDPFDVRVPQIRVISYYENILVDFPD